MQIKTAFTDAILSAVVPLTDEEQRRHDFATAALDMARRSLLSEYAKLMRELVRSVRQSSWQRSHVDLLKTVSYDDYVTWTEYFQGFACRKMLPSGIRQIACKFSLVLGHCEYLCSPDRKHGAIFASLPGGGRILLLGTGWLGNSRFRAGEGGRDLSQTH